MFILIVVMCGTDGCVPVANEELFSTDQECRAAYQLVEARVEALPEYDHPRSMQAKCVSWGVGA